MIKQKKINNNGFTLVELVIAIAILAIVGSVIMSFVASGTKQYTKTGNSIRLQEEAQLEMNQLQDMLIDATDGVSYYVNDVAVTSDAADITGAVNTKMVQVYNREVEGTDTTYSCQEVRWSAEQEKLLYSEYILERNDITNTWTWTQQVSNELFAEYVTDFSVDLSKLEKGSMISVKASFKVGTDEFSADKNVTVRNRVRVNGTEDEIFK